MNTHASHSDVVSLVPPPKFDETRDQEAGWLEHYVRCFFNPSSIILFSQRREIVAIRWLSAQAPTPHFPASSAISCSASGGPSADEMKHFWNDWVMPPCCAPRRIGSATNCPNSAWHWPSSQLLPRSQTRFPRKPLSCSLLKGWIHSYGSTFCRSCATRLAALCREGQVWFHAPLLASFPKDIPIIPSLPFAQTGSAFHCLLARERSTGAKISWFLWSRVDEFSWKGKRKAKKENNFHI